MKAIQITLDEATLRELDHWLKGQKRRRSAFIRESIRNHLNRLRVEQVEEQERRAYQRKPVRPGEFDVWDRIQKWDDE